MGRHDWRNSEPADGDHGRALIATLPRVAAFTDITRRRPRAARTRPLRLGDILRIEHGPRKMMWKRLVPIALAVVSASTASAEQPVSGPTPIVVAPEQLTNYWSPASGLTPVTYPPDLASRGTTGCVTLAYTIGSDGRTSDFHTLDADASVRSPLAKRQVIERFAQAAAGAVAQWQFAPVGERMPTITATTVQFDGKAANSPDACKDGDIALALRDGERFEDVLRNLYEAKARFWTQGQRAQQPSQFIR
ncbi:energy transducer TonB [Lysobacter sp. HA18]